MTNELRPGPIQVYFRGELWTGASRPLKLLGVAKHADRTAYRKILRRDGKLTINGETIFVFPPKKYLPQLAEKPT